jgi:hypothetical protein
VVEVLLAPAAAAFVDVGVFVAVLLVAFARLERRRGDAIVTRLARRPQLGPLVGASLGALPGCGGALVVMPLYLRGRVSFGTVVATLVATMGDSSFVLLATRPAIAVGVHATLLVAGVATGLAVDAAGLAPSRAATLTRLGTGDRVASKTAPRTRQHGVQDRPEPSQAAVSQAAAAQAAGGQTASPQPATRDTSTPPCVAPETTSSPTATPELAALRAVVRVFWVLVCAGAIVAVTELARPGSVTAGAGRTFPLASIVGAAGIACCFAIVWLGRRCTTPALGCTASASPGERAFAAARETATVVCWVAAAFVLVEVALATTGLALAGVPSVGLLGVLVGAALGLVPGCGPHLVITGLYVQGVIPLPMLLANALSQDGDALLPLLVLDRRAALLATALSTLPGLLVGAALVGLGW